MVDSFKEAVSQVLWEDFPGDASFPTDRPLLAHYTSVEVFEKILSGNEIWLANPLFMNDREELLFGMNQGATKLRSSDAIADACGSAKDFGALIEAFDYMFEDFDNNHALDTYTLCLCEHKQEDNDGLLSMWRGYGAQGGGVAMVFDTARLHAVESSPLVLGKVSYAPTKDRLAWIDDKLIAVAKLLKDAPKTDDNLVALAQTWINRLKMFSLFTKHIGFSEEREWRVVYFSERDSLGALAKMRGYSITHRGVEPKLKLVLEAIPGVQDSSASIEALTERVILGPSISTPAAAASMRRMLELKGKAELAKKVVPSSIPYRR